MSDLYNQQIYRKARVNIIHQSLTLLLFIKATHIINPLMKEESSIISSFFRTFYIHNAVQLTENKVQNLIKNTFVVIAIISSIFKSLHTFIYLNNKTKTYYKFHFSGKHKYYSKNRSMQHEMIHQFSFVYNCCT